MEILYEFTAADTEALVVAPDLSLRHRTRPVQGEADSHSITEPAADSPREVSSRDDFLHALGHPLTGRHHPLVGRLGHDVLQVRPQRRNCQRVARQGAADASDEEILE